MLLSRSAGIAKFFMGPGERGGAGGGLGEGGGSGGVEGDVAFDFLEHLVDVAVEDGDGAEAF